MLPAIERLAADVETAWARCGHADADFSAIAADLLNRPLDFDFPTLARLVCSGARLPAQRRLDQNFGQPAITLYRGDRFLIEALCWHTSTPAIHQHAFSGAFRVMTGSSVHSRYSYEERSRLGAVSIGTLRLEEAQVLDGTSTVPIPRGCALIHANFHLDSPTMTVVVRTHAGSEPELTYLPPGVAYDSAARTEALHKRLELLDTMHRVGHPGYLECLFAAIDHADVYDGMAVVMRAGGRVDEGVFRVATERFRARHGAEAEPVIAALYEERRRGMLVRLRGEVTDPESRFFLAGLLSVSSRRELLDMMVLRCGTGSSVRARVASGVARLLGGDTDRQLVSAVATEAILDDVPPAAFAAWAERLWQRRLTDDEARVIAGYYRQVCQHPLLTPLVSRELGA